MAGTTCPPGSASQARRANVSRQPGQPSNRARWANQKGKPGKRADSDGEMDANQHIVQVLGNEIKNRQHLQQTNVENCDESKLQGDDTENNHGTTHMTIRNKCIVKCEHKQFLCVKDRVIHKQKEVKKQMTEKGKRTQEASEQIKIHIAALERLLQEKDFQIRTPDVLIS